MSGGTFPPRGQVVYSWGGYLWAEGKQEKERRVRQRIRASLKQIRHDLDAGCKCSTCQQVLAIAAAYN